MERWDDLKDEELVRLTAAGDRAAEELLIRRYRGLVYQRAKPYFLPGADREDIVQEGMIGLCEAIRAFDPEKYPIFSTFASACVVRQILSAVTNYNRQKHMPLNLSYSLNTPLDGEEDLTLLAVLPDEAGPSLEETFISREERALLGQLIKAHLTPLERQVFLWYLHGERYADIARRLGKSERSVDSTVQRSRRKLRQALAVSEEE